MDINQLENNHRNPGSRRPYEQLLITPVPMEVSKVILSTSVVDNSAIKAMGQEKAESVSFDSFSSDFGYTFNHDWEGGDL